MELRREHLSPKPGLLTVDLCDDVERNEILIYPSDGESFSFTDFFLISILIITTKSSRSVRLQPGGR